MKLAIGFITYNESTLKYLPSFLLSLKEALYFLDKDKYSILAFDNSQDDNLNRLALEFFSLKNEIDIDYNSEGKNIGFGRAYNVLLNKADKLKAEYFLLINPDILIEKEAISEMLKFLDKNHEVTAVSPKILRWDFNKSLKTNQIDSCGLKLGPGLKFSDIGQGEEDGGQYDNLTKILAPSGAAGLFRLSDLNRIKEKGNYFDPNFFMYKEDCDLAYRLKLSNLKSHFIKDAILYHDRTSAFYGKGLLSRFLNRRKKNPQLNAWAFYNQHLLFVKYFSYESIYGRLIVLFRIFILFIFSLILEQYNLKTYRRIFKQISID